MTEQSPKSDLHPSIVALYGSQKKLFKRLISSAFSLAGCYWIFIYACRWMGVITEHDIAVLRSGQTLPYFVLLTLWGMEYLRETRRLKAVIRVANQLDKPPVAVEFSSLGSSKHSFGILIPIQKRVTVPLLVNVVGLTVSAFLIVKQYNALVRLLLS